MKRNIFRNILWLIKPICVFSLLVTASTGWAQTETAKVLASDDEANDQFGFTSSLSGDTVVVGAILDDHSTPNKANAGSAYVYEKDQGGTDNWGEIKILRPSDLEAGDQFGIVAIDGDTIAVGAPVQADLGDFTGAVYIFYRHQDGTDNWGQVKKIVGPMMRLASEHQLRSVVIMLLLVHPEQLMFQLPAKHGYTDAIKVVLIIGER